MIEKRTIHQRLNELSNNIIEKTTQKEILENCLKDYQSKKFDVNEKISTLEKEISAKNSEYHKISNKINQNEIEIGKLEVKIDTLLTELSSEYNITYEYAQNNYTLDMDITLARNNVNSLKSELKKLIPN